MDAKVTIRPEQPKDAQAIEDLIKEAYAAISYSDHREHLMVERLRTSAAYIPELSLRAEVEGARPGRPGFGRFTATAVIAVAMVALILLSPKLRRPASVRVGAS